MQEPLASEPERIPPPDQRQACEDLKENPGSNQAGQKPFQKSAIDAGQLRQRDQRKSGHQEAPVGMDQGRVADGESQRR